MTSVEAEEREILVVSASLCLHFKEVNAISAERYLDTFAVITATLKQLGMVFGFVTKDVEGKLTILKRHIQERGSDTLDELVMYEIKNDCVRTKKKDSASRTILRLNRALEFIAAFVRELVSASSAIKAGQIAYKATLSQHHPWLVQKSVGIALNTLGSRDAVLEKFGYRASKHNEADFLGTIEASLMPICTHLNTMYTEHNITDLP